jgi:glycosyltransferase involved in cell wall biosynthesis
MLAVTAPPMIASGALAVATARRVPLVMWAQDVYPDIAVAFGMISATSPAAIGLSALMRLTYRASSRVVVLSPGMRDRLAAQGAPIDRLRVIPNWSDGRAIRPLAPEKNPFRREHHLEDRFVVMYSGNLGVGHDVATFISAARLLEHRCPRALLLFIGEGTRRAEAEDLARGLSNVRFLGYQPYETLGYSLAAADVHLISLRTGLEGLLVPSKLYGALATARPVMFVGPEQCEAARVISENNLGWQGRPGDAQGLADAIAIAAGSPAWCAERGQRARALFEAELDRPIAVARWRRTLEEAAG